MTMAEAIPYITAALGLKQLFTPSPQKPATLGYGEATSRAGDVINPMYDVKAKNTLEGLDKNLVSRGFYGQRPGDTLVMDTMGDLEAQRAAQIAGLASDMVGRSEANALSEWALMSDLQQRQQGGMLGGLETLQNAKYLPSLQQLFQQLFPGKQGGTTNLQALNPPSLLEFKPLPKPSSLNTPYTPTHKYSNEMKLKYGNWLNPHGGG
jgi:hypothetical protein